MDIMQMKTKLSKTLGTLLAGVTLAFAGCEKQDSKQYLMLRKDLSYCTEHYAVNPMEVSIFSPAKDQTARAMNFYVIVNADEVRKNCLNPDNMCEHNHKLWRKYIGNPIE